MTSLASSATKSEAMKLSKNKGNRYLSDGQQICICIARPLHGNVKLYLPKNTRHIIIFVFYFRFANDDFKSRNTTRSMPIQIKKKQSNEKKTNVANGLFRNIEFQCVE